MRDILDIFPAGPEESLERLVKQGLSQRNTKGGIKTFNRSAFPAGEQRGFGFHEAPRGVPSHWIVIKDGQSKNYQAVVASIWNAEPGNIQDAPGPYEASLVSNPVADLERPLEVIKTVHSSAPCFVCANHMVDRRHQEIVRAKTV